LYLVLLHVKDCSQRKSESATDHNNACALWSLCLLLLTLGPGWSHLCLLQASTPGLTFLAPKEFTKVMAEGQVVFQRPHDPTGKEAGTLAVTAEALAAVTGVCMGRKEGRKAEAQPMQLLLCSVKPWGLA
jgi:hypothetical protein